MLINRVEKISGCRARELADVGQDIALRLDQLLVARRLHQAHQGLDHGHARPHQGIHLAAEQDQVFQGGGLTAQIVHD